MKVDANIIQKELMQFVRSGSSDMVIPNCHLGFYEMDVVKIARSGYITEYEIKMSRSDFKADFKKGLRSGQKHEKLKCGDGKANRFYFVVPVDLVSVDEVPDHCGLIYFSNGHLSVVKNDKLLHKRKFDEWSHLATKMYWRAENARRREIYFKGQIYQYQQKIINLKKLIPTP